MQPNDQPPQNQPGSPSPEQPPMPQNTQPEPQYYPDQNPAPQPVPAPNYQPQNAQPAQQIPYSETNAAQENELPQQQPIRWTAIEYIQHSKQPLWYAGFVVAVIVLMLLAILLIKSWTFAILIPVMAAALMVYSHRPPRELSYVLSEKGLFINDQLHPLGEFKSFGVMQDIELHALMLIPTKRFRPGLTVYFPTEVGEELVDFLGARLPMEELHPDVFDKIVRALRL